jgi:type IV pilus assembly protein PilQ
MINFNRFEGLKPTVVFLVLTAFFAAAYAQDNPEKKEVFSELELRLQKKISVEFKDTPIEDVIQTLAEQANLDVIKSPEVVGNVTARLNNVPLSEALENILAAHGYGYLATESIIRIAPAEQIAQRAEKPISKIYRITFADVGEVEKSLKKFISAGGSISSNPGTNNVIVTDSESKIKAIDTFIQEIDRKTSQILVEARIYDITCKDRLDLGIEWQAGGNTTWATGKGITDVGDNPTGDKSPFATSVFDGTTSKTANTTAAMRLGWLHSGIDIDMLIKAQKEDINAKLLANPRILVLDNQPAEIKIVSQIPYQKLNQGGGTTVAFGTTEFKEVGVTLAVIPHLARDGLVRLQLKPKFSVQTDSVTFTSMELSYPQPVVDEREATTTLLVKDGQTIVLGGLRKKDVTQQINKIPLLGDLPVVGSLFRFEGENNVTSELVVFITPRIIDEPTLSADEKDKLSVTDFKDPKPIETRAEKAQKDEKAKK